MAIPSVTFKFNLQGVSVQAPAVGQVPLVVGWATSGPTVGSPTPSIQTLGSEKVALATLGSGPLLEAVQGYLEAGAPMVLALRIFSGTIAAATTTHTGTGTGTISWSGSPMGPYGAAVSAGVTGGPIVKITTASGAGTAGQFSYSLDGGNTYSAPQAIPATPFSFAIPNTGITITFSAQVGAGVWVLADLYNANITSAAGTIGAVTQQNLGSGAPQGAGNVAVAAIAAAPGPYDAYEIVVQIISSGSIAGTAGQSTATFQYSLDGGNTWSSVLAVPSSGTYDIGEAGELQLTFTNAGGKGTGTAFQVNDQYLCDTTAPYYTTTDIGNVFSAAILPATQKYGFIDWVGRPSTAAASYTVASTIDALMSTAEGQNRFIWSLIETPPNVNGSGDAALQASGFSNPNLPSLRVAVAAGDVSFTTPDGLELERCCTWPAGIVSALVRPGQDLAWVGAGGIGEVANILRDESQLQTLDGLGFITTRNWYGKQGFFFTSAQIMGAQGTNFQYLVARRVMDEACTAAYQRIVNYVNQGLLANATTGFIDGRQAQEINNDANGAMYDAVTANGDATTCACSVDQTAPIVETGTLPVTIEVVALVYGRQITVTAGFAVKLANVPA